MLILGFDYANIQKKMACLTKIRIKDIKFKENLMFRNYLLTLHHSAPLWSIAYTTV